MDKHMSKDELNSKGKCRVTVYISASDKCVCYIELFPPPPSHTPLTNPCPPVLPAGRKLCKITQKGLYKIVYTNNPKNSKYKVQIFPVFAEFFSENGPETLPRPGNSAALMPPPLPFESLSLSLPL